jgi:hypothetical protein
MPAASQVTQPPAYEPTSGLGSTTHGAGWGTRGRRHGWTAHAAAVATSCGSSAGVGRVAMSATGIPHDRMPGDRAPTRHRHRAPALVPSSSSCPPSPRSSAGACTTLARARQPPTSTPRPRRPPAPVVQLDQPAAPVKLPEPTPAPIDQAATAPARKVRTPRRPTTGATKVKRSPHGWRPIIEAAPAEHADLNRKQLAAKLDISDRWLRECLSAA